MADLSVWLDGLKVAELRQRSSAISCAYTEEALGSWPLNSPVISCSLPLSPRPQDALPFFRGLLPEGRALQTLADQAGLATNDTYALLARYGRDVAGALVICEGEPQERQFGVAPYTRKALRAEIEGLGDHPLGSYDDSELSLAGLQDKLLLVQHGKGKWGRPLHGRPSTHILKVDDPRRAGLIDAEAECLLLARDAGLTDIDVELETYGDARCLIVSRFDRLVEGDEVRRIHQEDLCQALGIDPDAQKRRAKYEAAGGPSLKHAANLLDSYAQDSTSELDRLVAITTFTVLIGNADAHGKNLAFLHPNQERIELAPLYDTVPTALWPRLRREAAMSIGGQVVLSDVSLGDIVREAVIWRHEKARAEEVAVETINTLLTAIRKGVIPPRSKVAKFVRARGRELLRGRPG
jgi:serine/threonine-protein kinase HipA